MELRSLRKQCGLSQEQLAALVGVSQASISEWESGSSNPSVKSILKLSDVLSCTSDELLGIARTDEHLSDAQEPQE